MLRVLILACLAACAAGCANVAPWERGKLAHPSMAERHESPGRAHLLGVQEGASGGETAQASGCGCN